MYLDEYKRWLAADLEDADLKPELSKIEGNDEEIKDRFAVALKFGTAGLRGVLGAGTNRMNIYVVRQATQGLANWVKTQGGSQTVAISYDSRLKSDVFAKTAAGVLAANGIKVRIYDALMPVPALSFATRYYECNAGIMVTASHNPAKYNGYKAYGPDGCQMTDDAAAIVYDEIQKTDVLTGAKYISFAAGVEQGLIRFVGDDCKKALYDAIEARQVRPGLCRTAGLKLVYSPLNGSGLVPVTHVLNDMGITDITIVPEQEYPNGYFTTCSYPNPEIFEALKLGLDLATKTGADLMLATDPDADRVGIAMKCPDGSYELVAGERRLRACKMAKMQTIPAILCDYADDKTAAMGLLENLQRENLNPFEQAQGLRDVMVLWDCTQAEAAKRLGMAQPTLANKLRLLQLTQDQRQFVLDNGLTERHARAVLRLPENRRSEALITLSLIHI